MADLASEVAKLLKITPQSDWERVLRHHFGGDCQYWRKRDPETTSRVKALASQGVPMRTAQYRVYGK